MAAALTIATATAEFKIFISNEPLVLRSSMPDSSPRSIAVGLPGGEAFCFDAANARFRYAWNVSEPGAAFLDMRPLWTGRGGRNINVLGDRYFTASGESPIRFRTADNLPETIRFRGYRILEEGPEFRYEIDGVSVSETIMVAPSGEGLLRRFTVDSPDEDIWFFIGDDVDGAVTSPQSPLDGGYFRFPKKSFVQFDILVHRGPAE